MNKSVMDYFFDDDQTIAKNLHLNYTIGDLLEAVLLYEVKFRLKNKYNLDEKTIEENYEKLEDMIFKKADIFKYDDMDTIIEEYFNFTNNKKEEKQYE